MQKFLRYHGEKPRVGYVCVKSTPRFPIENYNRGQGVGKLLYFAAAVALDRMGLPFYSSTLQSPDAQRAWKGLEVAGMATRHTVGGAKRMKLHAASIPRELFEPAEATRLEQELDLTPGM